jgi:hypothetical protein
MPEEQRPDNSRLKPSMAREPAALEAASASFRYLQTEAQGTFFGTARLRPRTGAQNSHGFAVAMKNLPGISCIQD